MKDASEKPAALILPGLDGTGLLLDAFAQALQPMFRPIIVRYPTHEALGYDALHRLIEDQRPQGDYLVIGESFSGPLALRHALRQPPGLKGVVLGASFARLDLPCKPALKALARAVPPRLVPLSLLAPFLLGRWSTAEWRQRMRAALVQVAPAVLAARTTAALEVDLTSERLDVPLLYLRATEDRLMPRSAASTVSALAPEMTVSEIAAPHFLFQTAPEACAATIASFYQSIIDCRESKPR